MRCFWSRLNWAVKHLRTHISLQLRAEGGRVGVYVGSGEAEMRIEEEAVQRELRGAVQGEYLSKLMQLPAQGKTFHLSRDPASTHFLCSGKYTRFCD